VDGGGASYGRSGGDGEGVGVAKQRRPRSECGRHGQRRCSDRAADGWAPTVLDFFFNLYKIGSTLKIKMGAYLALKIPNFCMSLARDIMNNFLNCADIQCPIQMEIKILK
jgi:hypothetical protein